MKHGKEVLALVMIFLGVIFLLENLSVIRFNFLQVWPVFVILGGAGFWLGYLVNRKRLSLVMPGTILIIYGLLFLYCDIVTWDHMEFLWPFFLLGPGTGFFLLYFLGNRDRALLMPAGILSVLSLLFLFRYVDYLRYWPILLILGGVYLILYKDRKPKDDDGNQKKTTS